MKLARFPYVVQKEILDHLSINQTFFLSLCSKNTKNFIIQSQKPQFKKIQRVEYWINERVWAVKVNISGTASTVMYLMRSKDDVMEFKILNRNDMVEVKVPELRASVDFFRCPKNEPSLHAKINAGNVESTLEEIHNHLYDLLGQDTKFWMYRFSTGPHLIPMLRNIQLMEVFGNNFEAKKIEDLVSRSTCLEYFGWIAPYGQKIDFANNSKIREVDTVHVDHLAPDVIKHFNGRHAFLTGFKIETGDLIQFFNEWKAGEKFRNLEVISMEGCYQFLDIRKSVEFKEANKEVVYSFVRKHQENAPFEPCQFKSHLYIVRKTDGHVASVLLGRYNTFMGVWNMTEKEFLKKFNEPQDVGSSNPLERLYC